MNNKVLCDRALHLSTMTSFSPAQTIPALESHESEWNLLGISVKMIFGSFFQLIELNVCSGLDSLPEEERDNERKTC